MKDTKKNYLNNTDLKKEIIISKKKGKASNELINMFMLIAKNVTRKLTYQNYDDRKDCIQEGLLQMLLNYHKFNEDKYDNAMAYITEICKRGLAKQWNEFNYIKAASMINDDNERVTCKIYLPVVKFNLELLG